MHGELGLDLEPLGNRRKRLDETPRERAIAGEHVFEFAAEEQPGHAVEQDVAEPVTAAMRRRVAGQPRADHHVEIGAYDALDQLVDPRGVIGRVAVAHDVNIGIDIREHATHYIAFSLTLLAAHDRSSRERALGGAVSRVVVVDIYRRVWPSTAEFPHRFANRRLFVVTREQDGYSHRVFSRAPSRLVFDPVGGAPAVDRSVALMSF